MDERIFPAGWSMRGIGMALAAGLRCGELLGWVQCDGSEVELFRG